MSFYAFNTSSITTLAGRYVSVKSIRWKHKIKRLGSVCVKLGSGVCQQSGLLTTKNWASESIKTKHTHQLTEYLLAHSIIIRLERVKLKKKIVQSLQLLWSNSPHWYILNEKANDGDRTSYFIGLWFNQFHQGLVSSIYY